MSARRRLLIAVGAGMVVFGGLAAVIALRASPGPTSVRGLTVQAFGGSGTVSVDDHLGRPLVINTWASWCRPCVEEMPHFQSVYEEVSPRVRFLGLNIRDTAPAAEELVASTGVRYPLAADPVGDTYLSLRLVGMPTTLFVSSEGRVVHRHTGPLTRSELRSAISRHLDV
ncbi:MAG TPA: TlpA disulfide reductase family protein [Actinomycetota bacterium]|nr:TlpA disulfide reductase family protein [Actinomycetota bacterium]